MKNHVLWGRIDDFLDSQSKSSSSRKSDEEDVKNFHNFTKLHKRNVNPEDVTLLSSSDLSSSLPSGTTPTTPAPGVTLVNNNGASSSASSTAALARPAPAVCETPGQAAADSADEAGGEQQPQQNHNKAAASVDGSLASRIPLDAEGRLTSLGSVGHAVGDCKECIFAFSSVGCKHGVRCTYCHFKHETRKAKPKKRPSKDNRDRFRKLVHVLKYDIETNHGLLELAAIDLPPSIASNAQLKDRLFSRLQAFKEQACGAGGSEAAPAAESSIVESI